MVNLELVARAPAEVGVAPDRLELLFAAVQRRVDAGSIPGAQVAVGRGGKLAGMRSFGSAVQGGRERPVDDETLFCIYSSTKAIVGAAMWALIEDGQLAIEERVADIVPEFTGHGKSEITAEQVMLHIGGFPHAPMHPRLWEDRAARLERIKGWRLNWEPGSRFEYHATAAHWVLVEVITNRTGKDFRDYVRERLLEPMGIRDLFVGLPDDQHARAADVVYMEEPPDPADVAGEVNRDTILHFNLPSQRRAGCPGGGAFASAGALALFYQALMQDGRTGARQALKAESVEMATQVRTDPQLHRNPLTDIAVNRGLTVVVAGDDGNGHMRGFGDGTSPLAFGHGGAGGQVTWGDPASGISLAFVTNGFAADQEISERTRELSTLAAACAT
jgi:CubicO group peptidase (beta-lactamase class C family)